MLNIFYLENNRQAKEFEELSQIHLPLETICQLEDFCDTEFNIVNNANIDLLKDAPTLIPIDYQSTPLSYESRNNIDAVSHLGKIVQQIVKKSCELIIGKKIFLLYSTTEPYFNDNTLFINELAKTYPNSTFVVSGSGYVPCNHDVNTEQLKERNNVFMIYKLWYYDRIHYIKEISNLKDTPRHYNEYDLEPPADAPEYTTCPNRFLLTMRNPRPHRLVMSTLVEREVGSIRYSRTWSLQPWWLDKIKEDIEEEYQYQVNLLSNAIKGVIDVVDTSQDDPMVREMMHTLFHPPHLLDMEGFADRGHPGKWLYDNIDIVVAPTGESFGYGYADDKQYIPMIYKKPYITFGQKGVYDELEKIGFDTYKNIFDLTFDKQDNMIKRVKGCYNYMMSLSTLDHNTIKKLLDKCEPVIEYNYQHLKSGNFRNISNKNFFREVLNASN